MRAERHLPDDGPYIAFVRAITDMSTLLETTMSHLPAPAGPHQEPVEGLRVAACTHTDCMYVNGVRRCLRCGKQVDNLP